MTDEELIARLRNHATDVWHYAAADRIKAQAAEIERLETYRKKTYEGLLEVTRIHDEVEAKLENLLGGAETVLEAWDRGDEASFREAVEEMRADVEEAKGGKDE